MATVLFIIKPRHLLTNELMDNWTEANSYLFECLIFFSLACLFMISFRIMIVNKRYLKHEKVNRMYGTIWKELKTDSKMSLFYNLIFIARRSLMCLSYLMLVNYNYFQL